MPKLITIELLPMGKVLRVDPGTPLQELLFSEGVEFPCGGKGRCKGCRIKVLSGSLPVTDEDARCLSQAELSQGWRLACRAEANSDLTIDLAQWEAPILADDSGFAFTPRDGLGVAIDLGTTTLVAQLLDLRTGHVLAVRTALNAQAQFGADIMSRVELALKEDGLARLSQIIRGQIFDLIDELFLVAEANAKAHSPGTLNPDLPRQLQDVVIVGNTVMHHLFCELDLKPLAHYPFEATDDGLKLFSSAHFTWDPESWVPDWAAKATFRFLPCLGGFVGSDILAGILATRLHESKSLVALIDLGTNGEIVVGNQEGLLCASTAAGPAFEGARISMGMRAATGAISEVALKDGELRAHVLGNVPPRGICGSGLVDAVACALNQGRLQYTGKLNEGSGFTVASPVQVTQGDIRELQLAKAAIAAGLRILLHRWGAEPKDLSQIYLAGAFGNYINRVSARRIGLIDFPPEKVLPSGNTALLGAKLALANLVAEDGACAPLRKKIQHVPLSSDPEFHEIFVDAMYFPD